MSGKNAKRLWVLDADLAAAFDRIDHDHLLSMLGSFPDRDLIRAWLKAGVFEKGKAFAPTEEGTPQGGVISPLVAVQPWWRDVRWGARRRCPG
jgi:RNA-directed DNA polymerase